MWPRTRTEREQCVAPVPLEYVLESGNECGNCRVGCTLSSETAPHERLRQTMERDNVAHCDNGTFVQRQQCATDRVLRGLCAPFENLKRYIPCLTKREQVDELNRERIVSRTSNVVEFLE